jgi:hypothetical protein
MGESDVADPDHVREDADPDPNFHLAADSDPTFTSLPVRIRLYTFDTNPERLPEIKQIHRIRNRNTVRECTQYYHVQDGENICMGTNWAAVFVRI